MFLTIARSVVVLSLSSIQFFVPRLDRQNLEGALISEATMANGAPGSGGKLGGTKGGGKAPRGKPSNKGLKGKSRRTAASGKGSKQPRRGINRG